MGKLSKLGHYTHALTDHHLLCTDPAALGFGAQVASAQAAHHQPVQGVLVMSAGTHPSSQREATNQPTNHPPASSERLCTLTRPLGLCTKSRAQAALQKPSLHKGVAVEEVPQAPVPEDENLQHCEAISNVRPLNQ